MADPDYKYQPTPNDIATTALFMGRGLESYLASSESFADEFSAACERHGHGQLEACEQLASFATLAHEYIAKFDDGEGVPGVFDYEVSEEFGREFGRLFCDDAAANDRLRGILHAMVLKFFAQGAAPTAKPVIEVDRLEAILRLHDEGNSANVAEVLRAMIRQSHKEAAGF